MTKQAEIREYLLGNMKYLKSLVQSINSYNGSFDDLEAWENDEEFFETYFREDPFKAVRLWYFGECSWNDAYIRFASDGNLETLTQYDYDTELEDNIEEVIEQVMDIPQQYLYLTKEMKDLLNAEDEDEDEE